MTDVEQTVQPKPLPDPSLSREWSFTGGQSETIVVPMPPLHNTLKIAFRATVSATSIDFAPATPPVDAAWRIWQKIRVNAYGHDYAAIDTALTEGAIHLPDTTPVTVDDIATGYGNPYLDISSGLYVEEVTLVISTSVMFGGFIGNGTVRPHGLAGTLAFDIVTSEREFPG